MRNISFSLTTEQIRNQTKTVTRRIGWAWLTPGTLLQPIVKGQGIKKGERVETIGGPIRVEKVTREPLNVIGYADVDREGFKGMLPTDFMWMFCKSHKGCTNRSTVTRIEFSYTEPKQ